MVANDDTGESMESQERTSSGMFIFKTEVRTQTAALAIYNPLILVSDLQLYGLCFQLFRMKLLTVLTPGLLPGLSSQKVRIQN